MATLGWKVSLRKDKGLRSHLKPKYVFSEFKKYFLYSTMCAKKWSESVLWIKLNKTNG
ncbi:hypothetical protein SAMN02745161_3060 [Halodesulfovibrio marinisediminis DSM 17456]|uniref:Uncharacterized protein n=1 Tax=Halodesulfovibrio marinisediminis DSM 17456 TaxID=1121457 RepID=A0A1N6J1I1_9BACT|nr:hypothetical protein SAMN02745161_3060 [Halodesulfovibrio marinisediminis DSM 17456]